MTPGERRGAFAHALREGLAICWPIFSAILLLQAGLGAVIGLLEGWGIGTGIYFAFITGLTVGFGEFVPTTALTRTLTVLIGLSGIVLTGMIAALGVKAFYRSERN